MRNNPFKRIDRINETTDFGKGWEDAINQRESVKGYTPTPYYQKLSNAFADGLMRIANQKAFITVLNTIAFLIDPQKAVSKHSVESLWRIIEDEIDTAVNENPELAIKLNEVLGL